MEHRIVNEHVSYHHPVLRYKIWDIEFSAVEPEHWNTWHHHKEIEIFLLLEGSMQVETFDRIYQLHEHDLFIIGTSRLHRTRRLKPVKQIVLQFDMLAQIDSITKNYAPILLELSEPLDRLNEIMASQPNVKTAIKNLFIDIYKESGLREPGFEVAINGAFKQLITLMIRHIPSSSTMSHADWQRLEPVLDYIEAHFMERIQIHDVLPLVHFEYHYFIKYFQQCIGMSFVDYLHVRRIKNAEHLLLTERFSIADIGGQSGFPNIAQFIRIFKRYNGCTPSEFRKKRTATRELPE